MAASVKISPMNSIVFISDSNGGEPPLPMRGELIWSSESCVVVGCFPEQDGPTDITVGARQDVDPGYPVAFEGVLETPNRQIVVSTVMEETVLEWPSPAERARLSVWLSHPVWPEQVILGVDEVR